MFPLAVDTSFAGVVALLAILLSVLFQYAPKLKEWYDGLKDNTQRLVMLGAIVVVDAALFGLGCLNLVQVECTQVNAMQMFYALIAGVVANQGVFKILPNPNE